MKQAEGQSFCFAQADDFPSKTALDISPKSYYNTVLYDFGLFQR